jgi:hypothetical protein
MDASTEILVYLADISANVIKRAQYDPEEDVRDKDCYGGLRAVVQRHEAGRLQ